MENQTVASETVRGRPRKYQYPFAEMEPGQVATFNLRRQKVKPFRDRIAVAAHLFAKANPGVKFKVSRKKGEQTVTVYRVE